MTRFTRLAAATAGGLIIAFSPALSAQGRGAQPAPADEGVPSNLRPLLAPHRSEMRLVTVRYNADRSLLAGNYAGGGGRGGRGGGGGRGGRGAGGGRGGGRGAGDATPADTTTFPDITVSTARIARLKRFDLSWSTALAAIDSTALTPEARADLRDLKDSVRNNLTKLDTETRDRAHVLPLVPFMPDAVTIIEARLRHEDVNPQGAAESVFLLARSIHAIHARLDSSRMNTGANPLRPNKREALSAADAVDGLRGNLSAWFNFYNGYDPLFTWWMGVPQHKADSTLEAYAAFLRDSIAPMDMPSNLPQASAVIEPSTPAAYPDVPDLQEILALPQDELTDIVQRFRSGAPGRGGGGGGGRGGGGGGGRGGGAGGGGGAASAAGDTTSAAGARGGGAGAGGAGAGGAGAGGAGAGGAGAGGAGAAGGGRGGRGNAAPPDTAEVRKYYNDWLRALRTLDFDTLTRNAQVDYLYIKKASELAIARIGHPLPENPPRKTDNSGIPGAARGREGLIRDLQDEMITYTPEQLIVLAEREFAWHEAEMIKASREMGFGDDWKAALEKTKTMHVAPGEQPGMIRDLVFEAIDYLRDNDLVSVSQVTAESQRMAMMSAERQLVNPFFTGGSQITVSYPTDEMDYDTRMQSMRGNNRPWSHATAFHEQVPGHNLTGYYSQRFNGYRAPLGASGPFFGEGWPVYWEIIMYEKGFHDTPEERVGALFWRMHRCARIIFSLKFHMGEWSPQEAVDFLVERVGHEYDNAEAEVRRSFQGGYGPLYQAAYLLGAIQLRGLRRELVDSGQMPEKAFHDEVLRQGSMPIALIRLALTKQRLTRDMNIDWNFYGDLPER